MTESQLREKIELFVERQGSQTKAARLFGVSSTFLSDYLRGNRSVGEKLPAYFGLTRTIVYLPKKNQD